MDNQSKSPGQSNNEVDLGVFFLMISRVMQKIARFFRILLMGIFDAIIGIILLIKANWIILLIAGLAGLGFGLYTDFSQGAKYYSDMTVKTNFGSSRLLYQKIDLYNAMIKEKKVQELSKLFQISETEARKLKSFSIEPIKDALESAK